MIDFLRKAVGGMLLTTSAFVLVLVTYGVFVVLPRMYITGVEKVPEDGILGIAKGEGMALTVAAILFLAAKGIMPKKDWPNWKEVVNL